MLTITEEEGVKTSGVPGAGSRRFDWSTLEDSAGNLVVSITDSVTGTVDSYNTNISASAANNAAIAAYNQQILQVANQNALIEQEAREKQQEQITAALMVAALLVLGFLFLLFNRKSKSK